MITWLLIGWPVLGAFGLVAWSCRQPATPTKQAAADAEQAAYLAEWNAARVRYLERKAAKDSRGQHLAAKCAHRALHAQLRAELGR